MAALTNACHSPLGGARKLGQKSSYLGPAVGQCCVEKKGFKSTVELLDRHNPNGKSQGGLL